MVGDILLHTPVAKSGVQEDGSYNFDAVFENVKEEIAAADLAIVNQEVIIGGEELGITGYPSFNAPYELGDALVDTGFDVVLHATNHTLDKGGKGVNNCINFWKSNYPDIAILGINESEEEQDNNIYVYEQDGISVAILNYTYGTNGIPMPADMPYAVNLLDEEKVTEDIKKAEELADFTIVCPHWGTEYRLTSSAEQERWTDIFLENGAGLVIGTHPHVIEPVEWVRDDNGNEMLVYYSLGNFVNWTSGTGEGVANRMVGGMAEVTICKNVDGEAYISDYGVEPLVCHLSEGTNGVTTYLLSEYSQQLAAENMIVMQDSEFSLEYCENLCDEVWGELFR
ncbi:MAG: CapA family protein [Lachnospiraceae bacterium]|nr:CapA family protein [Lachnospiraceae bacterium]